MSVIITVEGEQEAVKTLIRKLIEEGPSPELEKFIETTKASKVRVGGGEWIDIPRMGSEDVW